MTNKEAYKIGFMLKCAELGVDPEETAHQAILYKQASPGVAIGAAGAGAGALLTKGVGNLYGEGKGLAGVLGKHLPLALAILLGTPIAAGHAGGRWAASVAEPPLNVSDIKRREQKSEYEHQIERLERSLRKRGIKV